MKLLTLTDLYNFYANQNQDFSFASANENDAIIVQIPETMTFSEDDYNPDLELLKTHLQACHILDNRNGSHISRETMEEAIPSIKNRPLLGHIHQLKDGSYDFAGHDAYVDDDGNTVYQEIPVGVIPESCNPQLVYDKKKKKTYLEVDGLIYEQYTKAAEILKSKGSAKVSIEIAIQELSFSATDKVLYIERFYFRGVTILGCTDDEAERPIGEGMLGSQIELADFSVHKNSLFSEENTKLIEALEKLNNTLANFNINGAFVPENHGKEEKTQLKFEELLAKYGKTVEDIEFDYENMSDEELEVAFAEAFEVSEETEVVTEVQNTEEENHEDIEPADEPVEPVNTEESVEAEDVVDAPEEIPVENYEVVSPAKYSITMSNGETKEFDLSLGDMNSALSNLVNATYGEADNAWYFVSVYPDDQYVIMEDFWSNKAYKQTYSREEDNFSLVGDRVSVYANWLTKDEEKSLADLRANYEIIKADLDKYVRAEKELIFAEEAYKIIKNTEEFKSLYNDMDKYSLEEIQDKCDTIYGKFQRSTQAAFAARAGMRKVAVDSATSTAPAYTPYGTLFAEFDNAN